ncbi:P-loop NTPase [Candidatus Woesearchaeota archaeon]|nr:P-loop NTPase [Candidatus Woesearchaeota archaeon]
MKTIGLLSGKGGVGKTSTAVNLSAALNTFGKQTILVDANITTPNVGLHLGVPTSPITLHHVLRGENKIEEAVYRHASGISFIPGSLALEDMNALKFSHLKSLKTLNTDFVILDGAAGLGREALAAMEHSDELIIITNPELPAMADALKTIRIAEDLGKEVRGVVITRAKQDKLDISPRNIEAMLEKPVIGIIPEDSNMRLALSMKNALVHTHPQSNAARAYRQLAAALIGEALADDTVKLNWIDKFFKLFKRKAQ